MRALTGGDQTPFLSPYRHGFLRVAAAVPHVRVGDPAFNGERTLALARSAHERHAALVIFPELGLAAYSSEDLFHQEALLDGVRRWVSLISIGFEPAAEGTRVTHTEQYTFLAWDGDGGHDQAHLRGSTQLAFNALAALVEA